MLNLRFLGTFHITFADGHEPAIETAKAKALFAYLATENDRPHLREQLAAMFWPEADQKASLQSLRQAIYGLRRQFKPISANGASEESPYLTITRQDVAFTFESEHWSDVELFTSILRATQQHTHRQLDSCPECISQLETAVGLYRGDFLLGFTLPDANLFEEWRLARQEWFRMQVTRALASLAAFHERRRDFAAAQHFLLRLLELEPWDEEAHRRLIRLYAFGNQRSAAIQQFEQTRRMLAQELGVEPSPETLRLMQTIQGGTTFVEPPPHTDSPYKGLYPFSLIDSTDFHGRELTVRQVLQQLERTPAVVLIGSSGSGKSSLIQAGVLPALLSRKAAPNAPTPATSWTVIELRPGADPFRSLAAAIAHLAKTPSQIEAWTQRLQTERMAPVIAELLPKQGRILLFVDQFEEIYTLCTSAAVRRAFVDGLLDHTDDAPLAQPAGAAAGLSVLISMRADFVSQALTHRPLADAFQQGSVVLGPMTRDALRRAIEEPARNRGVFFEAGLVDRLLDDVGEEPGNLPLLQFALAEMWARRVGWQIPHIAYDTIGQVAGALASYADQVYAQLSSAEQATARRIFIQLVQPGEATGDTRRPALRSELGEEGWGLARKLADLRLVVTGRGASEENVEIVHEALIRSWSQLRDWMAEDRDFRRWQQRLRTYLQQWLASNREEDALLRGALLTEAEQWIDLRRSDLSQSEQALIDDSIAARNQKQAALETARQVELERVQTLANAEAQRAEAEHRRAEIERTAGRRLRWLTIGLALVLVVAMGSAGFAALSRQEAQQSALHALARQLAAQSINLADDATDLAILLGQEALARMDDPLDRTNYLAAFHLNGLLDRFLRGGAGDLTQIAATPDGKHLLTVAEEGSLTSVARWDTLSGEVAKIVAPLAERAAVALAPDSALFATASAEEIQLWDGEEGALVASWATGASAPILTLQFAPDGATLLAKTETGDLIFWEIATRRITQRFTIPDSSEAVWLSPDNRTLAITQDVGEERGVDLWNAETGEKSDIRLGGHGSTISAVAFSPDGRKAATASFDGTVRLWDIATGELLHAPLAEHDGRVLSAVFSPDGAILATGGADDQIRLYDVESGEPIGEPLIGHDNWVRYLRFTAAGDALYSGATGGSLLRWDMTRRQRFDGHTDRVRSLALSPDGRTLATSGFDSRVLLWDAVSGAQLAELPSPHERSIIQTVFSPDGRVLATADAGGEIALWDVAERQLLHAPFTPHETVVIALAFSPDSQQLAVGDFDGNLSLWEVEGGALLDNVANAHDGWTSALTFASDGRTLASGGTDGKIRLWEIATAEATGDSMLRPRLEPIAAHDYWVTSLLFTADGDLLISGGADNTVRFWDPATGDETGAPLTKLPAQVWGVQFYPPDEERTLTVLSGNGAVQLWDIATRSLIRPTLDTGLETEAFVVSPEGNFVYLGSFDEHVERWSLDVHAWQQAGCTIAARTLTAAEWEQYLEDTPFAPLCTTP